MDNINVEELKSDKDFMEMVKALEQEVESTGSLAKIYQLLDVYLALQESEDKINSLFQKIVDGSFNIIASKIEKGEKLDLSDPEEWAAARGIYEFAIQKFSEKDTKSAVELFLSLYHTVSDSEVKDAMMVHAAAIESGYSFDDFFNKLAKLDGSDFNDPRAVFTTNFVQPVDILLEMFKDSVKKLEERLAKLKGN
jgi:hypothetical protein